MTHLSMLKDTIRSWTRLKLRCHPYSPCQESNQRNDLAHVPKRNHGRYHSTANINAMHKLHVSAGTRAMPC